MQMQLSGGERRQARSNVTQHADPRAGMRRPHPIKTCTARRGSSPFRAEEMGGEIRVLGIVVVNGHTLAANAAGCRHSPGSQPSPRCCNAPKLPCEHPHFSKWWAGRGRCSVGAMTLATGCSASRRRTVPECPCLGRSCTSESGRRAKC